MSQASGALSLPVEIWLHIFHFTTVPPEAFVFSDLPPTIPRQHFRQIDKHRLFNAAIHTGYSLVLVCKLWYTLATPYLYRTISLQRHRPAKLLWDTLKRSKRDAAQKPGATPLGWWSERLDISSWEGWNAETWFVEEIVGIISCMPNLTVATFSARYLPMNARIIDILRTRPLRVLELISLQFQVEEHLFQLSSAPPTLRVLACPQALRGDDLVPLPFAPVIKSLAISSNYWNVFLDDADDASQFPSLQTLVYFPETEDSAGLERFLRMYGSKLTGFELHEMWTDRPYDEMPLLARFCPNLVRLDLHVHVMSTVPIDVRELPKITILGVRCWETPMEGELSSLRQALETTPSSLKIVQFLSDRNLHDMQFDLLEELHLLIKAVSKMGISLQDPDGVDLCKKLGPSVDVD